MLRLNLLTAQAVGDLPVTTTATTADRAELPD